MRRAYMIAGCQPGRRTSAAAGGLSRTRALLPIALLFAQAAGALDLTFVAAEDAVELKIEIKARSGDFDDVAYANLALSSKGPSQERWDADEACDATVVISFEDPPINIEAMETQNILAVARRRDWAMSVERQLRPLQGNADIRLSAVFTDSAAKKLLEQYRDWEDVKAQLAGDDNKMQQLLKYRRRLTDGLLAVAWLQMRLENPDADARTDFWETEPAGSVTRTSDLDVTTVGYACSRAVKYFNEGFRGGFCRESGIVLDSNVYCEVFKVHRLVPLGIAAISESDDKDSACQASMALAKLRRYMTAAEWQQFVAKIGSGSARQAGELYEAAERDIKSRLNLSPSQSLAQCEAVPSGKPEQCPSSNDSNRCSKDGVMKVSNQLYADRLERLRGALASGKDADEIKFGQGLANLFANESYNSQGPLLHVLGVQQEKNAEIKARNEARLTVPQLLNSLNEQVGDALKDLAHYKSRDEAAIKSSKYTARALDALRRIRAVRDSSDAESGKGIFARTLLEEHFYQASALLELRKGAKPFYDHDDDVDWKEEHLAMLFPDGRPDIATLRSWLVESVIQINALVPTQKDAKCSVAAN